MVFQQSGACAPRELELVLNVIAGNVSDAWPGGRFLIPALAAVMLCLEDALKVLPQLRVKPYLSELIRVWDAT